MARKAREKSSLGLYHVILRGFGKLFISDEDILEFCSVSLKYFVADNELYAYSIDKNKVHLVFKTSKDIGHIMKPLCTSYARYFNRVHNATGKLFYDRYQSYAIEDKQTLLDTILYVSHKKALKTSLYEYETKTILCNISSLKGKNLINPDKIKLMKDDYSSMSDREVKALIEEIYGVNLKKLDDKELKSLVSEILMSANIAKARLLRIMGVKASVDNKKATPKNNKKTTKKSNTKEKISQKEEISEKVEEAPKKSKRELSVWLL